MKKTLAIILSLLCIVSLVAPTAFAEKVTKQEYVCTKEVTKDSAGTETITRTYDSKGNLTKESTVTKSSYGNYNQTVTYTYDSKGRLTKEVETTPGLIGKETYTTTYTYDSKGKATKKETVGKEGSVTTYTVTYTYEYDAKGNVVKETYKNKVVLYGTRTEITVNTYDSKNRLIKSVETDKDSDGSTDKTTSTYAYDTKGNVVKYTEKDNIKSVSCESSYDSKNNLIKQIYNYSAESNSENCVYEYTYDSKGNQIKYVEKGTTKEEDDTYTYTDTVVTTYNSKGSVLTEKDIYTDSDGDKNSTSTTCTYDSSNNLTKQVRVRQDANVKDTQTTTVTYDSNGRVTKRVEKDVYVDSKDSEENYTDTDTYTYTYDSKDNVLKAVYSNVVTDIDGTRKFTRTDAFTYDSHNNVTKHVETNEDSYDKEVTTYTYEYAKAKKATYIADEPDSIYYPARTYTYDEVQTYTGKAIKPEVEINMGMVIKLLRGVDYELEYSDNVKVGTGKITVKFIGDLEGTEDTVLKFKIVEPQVKSLKASTVKKDSISLSWSKVSGAKYYKVEKYDSANKKWVAVKTVETNTYTVSKLKAGTKYSFRVTALDSSKKKLGKVSETLKTQTLCSAPSIKLTSTKSKTATASWSKVTGASKYTVYKSTDGKKFTKVADTTKTSYSLTKLSGGKKIYVKVVAVNAYGKNSSASSVKSVTVKK